MPEHQPNIAATNKLDTFTTSFLVTLTWSSRDTDENGNEISFDNVEIPDGFAPETLEKLIKECHSFQDQAGELIGYDVSRAGHDFALTRNRHGAGFWDGDWPKHIGIQLTELSHTFGEVTLYFGDDGLVYTD